MLLFSSLSKRGMEISTPKKIAIGMGLAGIAYLFLTIFSYIEGYPSGTEFRDMATTVREGMKAGPWVLIALYFFLTVAELFISPLGLSFVSKWLPSISRVSARVCGSAQPPWATFCCGSAR